MDSDNKLKVHRKVPGSFEFKQNGVIRKWIGIQTSCQWFVSNNKYLIAYERNKDFEEYSCTILRTCKSLRGDILKTFPAHQSTFSWRKDSGNLARLDIGPQQNSAVIVREKRKEREKKWDTARVSY